MHKNPPKQRFITCGTSTRLEGISIVITLCLKRLLRYAPNTVMHINHIIPFSLWAIVKTASNFRRKFINEVFDASGKLFVNVNYNKAYQR